MVILVPIFWISEYLSILQLEQQYLYEDIFAQISDYSQLHIC